MIMPRKNGWSWKFICRLPGWIVRIRIAVLKRREQTEEVQGEIADCELQLSYIAFKNFTEAVYVNVFKEPFPQKSQPILITEKTVVISKKEMDASYKDYNKRLKGLHRDCGL
jgi:hypothetical protein